MSESPRIPGFRLRIYARRRDVVAATPGSAATLLTWDLEGFVAGEPVVRAPEIQ